MGDNNIIIYYYSYIEIFRIKKILNIKFVTWYINTYLTSMKIKNLDNIFHIENNMIYILYKLIIYFIF